MADSDVSVGDRRTPPQADAGVGVLQTMGAHSGL